MSTNPFDTIESAHEYVTLLLAQIEEVKTSLAEDRTSATERDFGRQLDALRLVEYKLDQLARHMASGSRLLNDLRALRRLLFQERLGRFAALDAADERLGAPELAASVR